MKISVAAVALSLGLGAALCAQASAQSASLPMAAMTTAAGERHGKTDWTRVQRLMPGTTVHVRTKKARVACRLSGADADSLTCEQGVPIVFRRADIRSVAVSRPRHHTVRGVMIDGALFGALGAVVGVVDTATNNYWQPQQRQGLGWGALEAAGVFDGVAALIVFWPRNEIVYKAP